MNAKTIVSLLGFTTAITALSGAPAEQNWGQWRGPHANGVSPNGDPPTEWSESKNVKWKFQIPGEGSATPIVWDNLVFVQTAVPVPKKPEAKVNLAPQFAGLQQPPPGGQPLPGDAPPPRRRPGGGGPGGPGGPGGRGGGMGGAPTSPFQFTLIAVDRTTGKTAWQKMLREEIPHEGAKPGDGNFASQSPIADGENVIAYFGSRGLYCLDLKGNVQWQKDLGKMKIIMSFGEGSSPALFGNVLVVNWDHQGEDFIAAFDKKTGNELWRQKRDEPTSWDTPLIVQHGGTTQVVVNAKAKVRSYDLMSGKELWSAGPLTSNPIPSPVAGNGMVYSMSGFQGNALLAIKLGRSGDLNGTDAIAWTHNKSTPYVPSPLLYDDRLYFFANNNGILTVLNAKTGETLVDAERLSGFSGVYASPVGAAGRVYLVARDGAALVLKKGDKVEVLATNKLEDHIDASPAIVGKELFLRGKRNLYCIAPTERAEAK
jgi:outer membrane protein assembly factor BamB